jgi:hypothetical protein
MSKPHTAKTPYQKFETEFLEMKLRMRSLVFNSYIHVYESDLYFPTIGPPIVLQQHRWTNRMDI